MTERKAVDPLADAVVAEIKGGMVVGLGTGRTAGRAIAALAQRVHDEGLDIRCVPTSHATETLARFHELPLVDFTMLERVDFLFDGADEVDPHCRMLKGSGGAMTRERIVAAAADRRVYIVDESKLVQRLGERTSLAIAVMTFGLQSIRERLRALCLPGVVRRTLDGQLFLTDNGNLVIDAKLDGRDLNTLAGDLNAVPGVVDHGLFLTEASEILVQQADGSIRRMTRGR